MNHNTAEAITAGGAGRRLAWGLLALGLALLTLGLFLRVPRGDLNSEVLLYLLTFNSFLLVGGVVASRRPEHPIGWLFLGVGLLTNLTLVLNEYAVMALVSSPGSWPGGGMAVWLVLFLQPSAWWLLFNSLLLFPTGRPVGARWGMVLMLAGAYGLFVFVYGAFASPVSTSDPVPNPYYISDLRPYQDMLTTSYSFLYILLMVITVILRFRRSSAVERQQLKWFTYSIFLPALLGLAQSVSGLLGLAIDDHIFTNLGVVTIFLIAAAIGIAILRYRLYAIDIIIRRTLVYTVLTVLLAGVYFGGVVLLQTLLRPLTGAGNDLAVVGTTLGIAALFLPLRRRVQGFIDRRFYRRKYDAAQTLAAFSATVRDETDLDRLTGRLVSVVDETMQPAHVALWLRQGEQNR